MSQHLDFYRGRRVLVTGGLGFVGSNLCRKLADLGAEVLAVDSLLPDYGGNLYNLNGYEDRIRGRLVEEMIAAADPSTIEPSLSVLKIAANLERIADLSTNIGEDVIYMTEGRVIKHHQEEGAR